jgi:para-nitrobenzyl esterase
MTDWLRAARAALVAAALAAPALAAPVLGEHQTSTVAVDSGAVVGGSEGGVLTFKGVPFAAAPEGDLRWAPPRAPPPWATARMADQFGPACPQKVSPDRPNAGGVMGPTSEDCLFLNVWTPRGAPEAGRRLPVMVWIYGGANLFGSGSLGAYDGWAFARDGVILVTFNYRLGVFGFFAHPAITQAAAPGEPLVSYGLMDQIAALQWVKRNIGVFGGDPANVTVFGESAGGVDILALMAAPSAKGLFAKAIVESGGGWSPAVTLARREAQGEALAVKARAPAGASLAQLRALPAQALVEAGERDFGPAVDGRLLTQSPSQAFAHGQFAHIPLIIGSNSHEASLMKSFGIPAPVIVAMAPAEVKAAYGDHETQDDLAADLFTDGFMGGPARWIAGKASADPSWLYHFGYVVEARRGKVKGADHASEIAFVFDSWDHLGILGEGVPVSAADHAVTRVMHSCWVAFARTGLPTCDGAPAWPAYTSANDQLMDFEATPAVTAHFRKAQYDAQEAHALTTLGVGK